MGKKPKIIWLQSITCNANAHSFLNHPNLFSILSHFSLQYHPVLETSYGLKDLSELKVPCDILIIEGAIREEGWKKNDIEVAQMIRHYATRASYIITVGTCATFGGIFKQKDPKKISGFCFDNDKKTFRYDLYKEKLISLPGCPIHPEWLSYLLLMIQSKKKIPLDGMHRPRELYGYTVHNGCTRNEYFEWKVDTPGFGHKEGCLFYEQGCQAPYTHGSCNKILWNDVSSKTRIGTPCFGCTEPNFPKQNFFQTETNMGIPAQMPLGVPKRAYLMLAGVAKSFKIKRFSQTLLEYDE